MLQRPLVLVSRACANSSASCGCISVFSFQHHDRSRSSRRLCPHRSLQSLGQSIGRSPSVTLYSKRVCQSFILYIPLSSSIFWLAIQSCRIKTEFIVRIEERLN